MITMMSSLPFFPTDKVKSRIKSLMLMELSIEKRIHNGGRI